LKERKSTSSLEKKRKYGTIAATTKRRMEEESAEVEFYIDDSRDTTYESEVVLHDRR
jgi:hypothetical protein